jgi:anti-sigma regulatory factor (Ser/Thr protein kinase)
MQIDLTLSLPPDERAALAARRVLRALDDGLSPELHERVELLVSELITNSFRHAHASDGEIRMHLFATRDHVRVEVCDNGRGFAPKRRTAASPEGSGWGLHFVEKLAQRWGVRRDGRTCVWFEIDAPTGSLFDSEHAGPARVISLREEEHPAH